MNWCPDSPVSEATAHHQEGNEANKEDNHQGNEASQAGIHLLFYLIHCGWLLKKVIVSSQAICVNLNIYENFMLS